MPYRSTNNIKLILILSFTLLLSACSTSKDELLPHDSTTMLDVWNQGTGGSVSVSGNQTAQQLMDARFQLRRPLTESELALQVSFQTNYTRQAHTEITNQFKRLPNPDLVMYVFPHLAGSDPVPVPGYSTVFPLYQRVQYAMPGERVEPY